MPLGTMRVKVLRGVARGRGRPHRYTIVRWIVATVTTIGIALLPILDVLRFDLWNGQHVYLGQQLDFATVARRFAFPFLFVNIAIVLVSRFLGRYLCGFACPYGALARLAEWTHSEQPRLRFVGGPRGVIFAASLLLAAITFSFWIDWRVFVQGTALARTLSGAFLLGTTVALYAAASQLGLAFCRDWCPSGVYFAVLGHETNAGIAFAHPESCTACGACEKVCPMDLEPRDLASGASRPGNGLYPDGLSNHAQCIRCGDCVVACEQVTARKDEPTPLVLGWLPSSAEPRTALPSGEDHGADAD